MILDAKRGTERQRSFALTASSSNSSNPVKCNLARGSALPMLQGKFRHRNLAQAQSVDAFRKPNEKYRLLGLEGCNSPAKLLCSFVLMKFIFQTRHSNPPELPYNPQC